MNNAYIVYDGRKIAAYNICTDYCKSKGWSEKFSEELWEGLLCDPILYDEFTYYLEMHELTGTTECEGYTMFDLYFYHLWNYHARHDLGKDTAAIDKEEIIFLAFHMMGRLRQEPEIYKPMLDQCEGMDLL